MKRGADWGYFPDPDKSLIILDTPGQQEVAIMEFLAEGSALNFVSECRYLGAYLVPQEELSVWVKPQVEACFHEVIFSGRILTMLTRVRRCY